MPISTHILTTLTVLSIGLPAMSAELPRDTPSPVSPDEIRALVADMLADAETRSSLLQSGATAGHDGQFFLASPDGAFRLNISGQIQTRYTTNFRDNDSDENDDFESGFTNPRMVIRFDGKLYDNFIYGIQGVFDRSGGDLTLEDAFAGYVSDGGWIFLAGQIREPTLWEDVLNDKYSLAVDQSVVNAVFAQGFSQGAWVHYAADSWRFWAGVNDGNRSANTDLEDDPADIGVTTRWEYKFAGDWSQFDRFSSPRGSKLAVKLGGGVHYEKSPRVEGPLPPLGIGTVDTDTFAYTGDIMVEGNGWNIFAMVVGLLADSNDGSPTFNDLGFMIQGGLFVTDNIEPFARYDVIIPDGDRDGSTAFNTLTAGANYYLHGQAAKLSVDVQYFFNKVSDNDLVAGTAGGAPGSAGSRIGLLPSNDEGQIAVRVQFQLLF